MNFFINQAMGMGNSGIEHAQFYRAKLFKQKNIPFRFVFLSLVKELHEAMDKWQLADNQVVNIWEYFVFGDQYLLKGLKHRYPTSSDMVIDGTNTNRKGEWVTSGGLRVVDHYEKHADRHDKNSKILLVSTYRTEIYAPDGHRKVMFERIDDPNRKELLQNIHIFDFDGQHLFFENAVKLYRFFFEQLNRAYGGNSTFIIDRDDYTGQALTKDRIPGTTLLMMIHADHLADRIDPNKPLWNNFYEYALTHMNSYDKFIVATELQRQDLLIDFPNATDKIVTIPVGGVSDNVTRTEKVSAHSPFKLITASRLADEKHIDMTVHAVAKLHAEGFKLSFDIYGQGSTKGTIQEAINEENAGEYISLKGLSDHLDTVYPEYDGFVTASFSEGFGLTTIEALNAHLPVVSFDARFGSQELVHNGINGFLVPFKRDDRDYTITELTTGIRKLLEADYGKLISQTASSVDDFRDSVIAKKWEVLLNEL